MVLAAVPSAGLVLSLRAVLCLVGARGVGLVLLVPPPLGVMPPLEVAPPLEGVGVMMLRREAESWFSSC